MTSSRPRAISRPLRDLPIFWKLLLPFLVLLMAVGSVGSYIVVRDLTTKSSAALSEQLTLRVIEARSLIHHRELDLLESANYASNLDGIADAVARRSTAAMAPLLASVLALRTELVVVAITDNRGGSLMERGHPTKDPPGWGLSGTDWSPFEPVRRSLERRDGTKTAGFVRIADRTLMVVVAPVCHGAPGCTRVGLTIVGLDAADLFRAKEQVTEESAGREHMTVFDAGGGVLTSTAASPPPAVALRSNAEIQQRRMDLDGRRVATAYAGFTLAGQPAGTVAVTVPAKTAFGSVGGAALRLVGLIVLAMGAAVVVGVAVSRRILRQLREVVETSRQLGAGNLSARAPVLSGDEHGELAGALNRMAEQLEASHETLELQVEQRTEEIRRLLRDRTEFFAGLSHELRTPLAIIITQAEMLLFAGNDRAARGEAGETIRESASQLLELVNDILDLARAEAGSIDVRLEPVRLANLLGDLRPMLVRLGSSSDIDVRVQLPARIPVVAADPARLREVLVNLVDNAIKYTPSGGSIVISAEADGDDVRISVADTGVGIPEDVGDRVFEPFYRVAGTAPQRGQASSGLGLALTRRWVEAQGGTISWAANPGGGTVFVFTLPMQASRRRRTALGREPSGNGRPDANRVSGNGAPLLRSSSSSRR